MDDDQGLASNLIQRAGGAPARVVEALDVAMTKIPKVSGDAGQTYLDTQTAKVLDEAEKVAKKAGDSFVPVERILMRSAWSSPRRKRRSRRRGHRAEAERGDQRHPQGTHRRQRLGRRGL